MKRGAALLLAMALLPATSFAGHGLLNSFGDLQWLPPPGRTPDQWNYVLDTWREQAALLMADTPQAEFALCLAYMRDKLADLEAMVGRDKREAANIAVDDYRAYRGRALKLIDKAPADGAMALRERLARSLLEHQYMLSVDYPDLPAAPRALVASLIDEIAQRYAELRAQLPRATAEALFFKEEEVRWSWEMGKRAQEETR
jgi:hypothetical protein